MRNHKNSNNGGRDVGDFAGHELVGGVSGRPTPWREDVEIYRYDTVPD